MMNAPVSPLFLSLAQAPAGGPVEVAGVPGAAQTGGAATGGAGAAGGAGAGGAGGVGGTGGAGDGAGLTGANGGPLGPVQPTGGGGLGLTPMIVMLAVVVGMFWLMSSSQRKEQKRLDALRQGLARNDKVQTTGGIIGTVVEVGDKDVVLRVDESSNTRIRFVRSAIVHVLNKDASGAAATAEAKPAAGTPVRA
ncbi:MAG: preprotein translocase subunit YajC [Phycisphaerales bacterium]